MRFRRKALTLFGLAAVTAASTAYAGPPFQTDDPEPIDYKHVEMYGFELSDGTGAHAGGTALQAPAYEVNYGALPNVHLHLVVPMAVAFQSMGAPTYFGLGDIETGVKLRFVQESAHRPQVGIFPFFELPSGSAQKALGVGSTWYRMPMWAQKSWGPKDTQWTSYGGGGETVFSGAGHAAGYDSFAFAGWLVQRQLNQKWMLGGELFGHGAEGPAAISTRSSVLLDLGGQYEFHDGFDLLFAAGRAVHGQAETYSYLALYWTWGPKGGDGGSGSGKTDGTSKVHSVMTNMHLR